MGFGKHVRIARPPPGFEALTNKEAEVVTLLPIANHPLLYEVRDEKGKTLTLPADALEPCKIDREEETGPMGYLIVNNLMYCQEHELEVCGKCGVDHRSGNFFRECTRDNSLELVEDWLDGMCTIGAPSRLAPKERGKVDDFPGNTAVFQPAISDHLLLLDRNACFDPSNSTPWPFGVPTEGRMRQHAAFTAADCNVPEFAKLPVRRVRETLVCLARRWDDLPLQALQESGSEPMPRLLLQDEAQTQVMSLDLVLPIRSLTLADGSLTIPIFVVRWMHCKGTDGLRGALSMMETMERGTNMAEIPVEVDEIEFLAEFLEKNTQLMDSTYVQKEGKRHLSVSVITSISDDMQNSHYKSIRAYCHQCGTSGCDMMKCSRCKRVQYCSRFCQKKNWKYHKNNGCI